MRTAEPAACVPAGGWERNVGGSSCGGRQVVLAGLLPPTPSQLQAVPPAGLSKAELKAYHTAFEAYRTSVMQVAASATLPVALRAMGGVDITSWHGWSPEEVR